jgi:16S rRNA (cytosine1402-N4)-methyltransferase
VPEFIHTPVLLNEVLEALRPRPGGRYVDGTVGGGGHAEALLQASAPDGFLYGCDRDDAALAAAGRRLARFAGRFELRQMDFARLAEWVPPASCDGVLLDLGVSSPQLDWPERGFSFQHDGPLDMRMDRREPVTAADLVNGLGEAELARILWEFGEEPRARRFARAIVQERRKQRFETTGQLARLIDRLSPRSGQRRHPATRVFQALRMEVNHEDRALESAPAAACRLLKPGGCLAVISFHSLEAARIKAFGDRESRVYDVAGEVDVPELRRPRVPTMKWVRRKAVRPGSAELETNPRARPAQLRVLEKL